MLYHAPEQQVPLIAESPDARNRNLDQYGRKQLQGYGGFLIAWF